MNKDIIGYFLPDGLLEYFIVTNALKKVDEKTKQIVLHIELEEINKIPAGYAGSQYESKGFYPVKLIQDFPIRGKAVYLSIKRRRWRDKTDKNKIIHNDYPLVAAGSKLTQELSDFLKGTVRDAS